MAIGTHFRQGDFLVVAVDQLPDDAVLVDTARGQRLTLDFDADSGSGSHTVFATHNLRTFASAESLGQPEWLQVDSGSVTLLHPQHGSMTLEAGIWHVVQQREFDPRSRVRLRMD